MALDLPGSGWSGSRVVAVEIESIFCPVPDAEKSGYWVLPRAPLKAKLTDAREVLEPMVILLPG
jgi:hypothetical protein